MGFVIDYLVSAGQKIPAWLINIIFLCKVETAVKSWFAVMGRGVANDSILGLFFFFFKQ